MSRYDHHYAERPTKKLSRNWRAVNDSLWSGNNYKAVMLVVCFFAVVLNLDTLGFAIKDLVRGGPSHVVEQYELRRDLDDYADDLRRDLPIKDSNGLTIIATSVDDVTLWFKFTMDIGSDDVDPDAHLAKWQPRMIRWFCGFESFYRFMGRGAVMEWTHGDRFEIGVASG